MNWSRWILVAPILLSGCFSPNYGNGTLQCTSAGQCPSGYVCSVGRCYRAGTQPQPDGGGQPISFPPASVWTTGAGSSLIGSNGARLNFSAGGTNVVGAAKGSQGSSVTWGYLGADTY